MEFGIDRRVQHGQTDRGTSSLDRAIVHRVSARRVLGNGRVPCGLAFGTDRPGHLLALSLIHFCFCQPENRLANVTRSEFLPAKYPAAEQATQHYENRLRVGVRQFLLP